MELEGEEYKKGRKGGGVRWTLSPRGSSLYLLTPFLLELEQIDF